MPKNADGEIYDGGREVVGHEDLYDKIVEGSSKVLNLDFKGFLPTVTIDKKFERAKLFINTSQREEFPNAFIIAWRRGIPVVSLLALKAI